MEKIKKAVLLLILISYLLLNVSIYGQQEVITWEKKFGGSSIDKAYCAQQTNDAGYIIAGYSWSEDIPGLKNNGRTDYYIIKLDTKGNIQWQKLYGGNDYDCARSIQQTNDGGYIIVGDSNSENIPRLKNHGSKDFYIIKLDSKGNIQWQKMYGGIGEDYAYCVQQTNDAGYIIAGYSWSEDIRGLKNHGRTDYYIIKLDSKGNIKWQKMYGGSGGDYAYCVQQTTDGGYIVAGYSLSEDISRLKSHGRTDYYIIKLDSKGNIKWQKMYGGSGDDWVYSIQQTKDQGYIVAGYSYSTDISGVKNYGRTDYYIIKLDSKGNIQWQKMYGGICDDCAYSIQQTNDGGYIIVGDSNSENIPRLKNHGSKDFYIIKLDSKGNIQWQKMYGGICDDCAYSIQQTNDGGYIVVGEANEPVSTEGEYEEPWSDILILKLDVNGNLGK